MRCAACGPGGPSLMGLRGQDLADVPAAGGAGHPGGGGATAGRGVPVRSRSRPRWARWSLMRSAGGRRSGSASMWRVSWRALPWEALALPGAGTPLALHPLLTVYRLQAAGQVPAAGPGRAAAGGDRDLRAAHRRGGVLDYERELRNMLAAVRGGARQGAGPGPDRAFRHHCRDPRRAGGRARPRAAPVRASASPGAIELEDQDGNARVLDARPVRGRGHPARVGCRR